MIDPVQTAVEALFTTLRDRLPARLRAADAERWARIVCAPGPYQLPAGELVINGTAVGIVAGEYSAEDLALLVEAAEVPDLEATLTDDGRLILEAEESPTARRPSQVRIEGGEIPAALGLPPTTGHADAVQLALSDPPLRLLRRTLRVNDEILGPTIGIDFARSTPALPVSQGIHQVAIRLAVVFPGFDGYDEATVEATVALAGHVVALVHEGDGRGPCLIGGETPAGLAVVKCIPKGFVPDWNPRPKGNAVSRVPFGTCTLDLDIEVFDVGP